MHLHTLSYSYHTASGIYAWILSTPWKVNKETISIFEDNLFQETEFSTKIHIFKIIDTPPLCCFLSWFSWGCSQKGREQPKHNSCKATGRQLNPHSTMWQLVVRSQESEASTSNPLAQIVASGIFLIFKFFLAAIFQILTFFWCI